MARTDASTPRRPAAASPAGRAAAIAAGVAVFAAGAVALAAGTGVFAAGAGVSATGAGVFTGGSAPAAFGAAPAAQDPLSPQVFPDAPARDDDPGGVPAPPPDPRDPAQREAQRIRDYFQIADYDGSGWLSFEEASEALGIDRDGFRLFDRDRDGRISFEEFTARYREVVERGGLFAEPRPQSLRPIPPLRTAEQLRAAYDLDLNGALDETELGLLLDDYRITSLTPRLVLSTLDRDGTGRLELPEIAQLAELLRALRREQELFGEEGRAAAPSLHELFGKRLGRPTGPGHVPSPPRIAGPVHPFARLDLDADGAIDLADLDALEFPLTLPVRAASVLASLDLNGDGRLDLEELRLAFEGPRERAHPAHVTASAEDRERLITPTPAPRPTQPMGLGGAGGLGGALGGGAGGGGAGGGGGRGPR